MRIVKIALLAIAIGLFAAWASDKVSGLSSQVQPAAQISERHIANPQQPASEQLETGASALQPAINPQD